MAPPAAVATSAVQRQILAAIQRLSDQLAAQGATEAASMELRFSGQDELTSLRANQRIDPIASRLDSIDKGQQTIITRLDTLNGTVRRHDTDITVMQKFCDEQVKPALGKVTDIRIEVAKLVAQGSGVGLVLAILAGIAKAAGWW